MFTLIGNNPLHDYKYGKKLENSGEGLVNLF